MTTDSSILAWIILWIEEPRRLLFMGFCKKWDITEQLSLLHFHLSLHWTSVNGLLACFLRNIPLYLPKLAKNYFNNW